MVGRLTNVEAEIFACSRIKNLLLTFSCRRWDSSFLGGAARKMRWMDHTSIKSYEVHGISSMMRDLDWLADDVPALETEILGMQRLDPLLRPQLEVRSGAQLTARVGDVVLFRALQPGAYSDMETTWGGRVSLVSGRTYIGVICERNSTKFFTARLGERRCPYDKLVLQFIAQAGGIGYCTGYSPALAKLTGCGRPADVEVLGVLYDASRQVYLNTISISGLASDDSQPPVGVPPTLLILGTTTDVGKTTMACRLLHGLSKTLRCVAIKASGTGWYEDSILHLGSGASWAMNFGFVGLPTTYWTDAALYTRAIYTLYRYVVHPGDLPLYKRPPNSRHEQPRRPQVLIVEHGGDVLGANVPVFLDDNCLMAPVRVVIVCSESALSLAGALAEMRSRRIGARHLRLYAAMPQVNPEGFIDRVTPYIDRGELHGIVDIHKPEHEPAGGWRREYADRHSQALSANDIVTEIERILTKEEILNK